MRQWRISWLGAILIAVTAAGVACFFAAPGALAGVGGIVAIVGIATVAGNRFAPGATGSFFTGASARRLGDGPRVEPEYIAKASEPTDDVWERERRRRQAEDDA